MLVRLTAEGLHTVKARPERIREVNTEIERMGARVLHQYATLGAYDFVNIVEAPDDLTIAQVSVTIGSRGTIHVQTLPAMDVDAFIERLRA